MDMFFRTHSTILKGSGGSDPSSENDEHGGHAAIIELVKSISFCFVFFPSFHLTTFSMI